ncbi:endonuclease/exonuclease/phosphatase family metal-dependent hydrolase [Nocardioides albertanoniae]|uniref:Endonuclease/exonuclease/phosphatase family metal-dependent hydrolase n=1 Tax=Nocardioides albertanoniae TaxID=1175486 RepID=A0A543AAD4_9ACTN|nr:endonuclease/exonuclease/phosphatase family protein [Nocardioides albertanoniae]TQL69568.1 endonuclease/exonuclease/phosphatase family metal-dependent hydrolase [Nocardioides albertanoniae]
MTRHRDRNRSARFKELLPIFAIVLTVGAIAALTVLAPRLDRAEKASADASTSPSAEPAPTTSGSPRPLPEFKKLAAPPAIAKVPKKPKIDPCAAPRDITVMTFNIKGGKVSPGELGGIADVIRASGADVVLLQEVDQNRRRSGNVDQPAIIASHLGMQSVFGANDWITDRGGYGNAILSRFPIDGSGNTHLPNRGGKEQRGVLRADIIVSGQRLVVFNTHLDHTSDSLRRTQIGAVMSKVGAYDGAKILGGDLNSGAGSGVLGAVLGSLSDAGASLGASHDGGGRVDYLLPNSWLAAGDGRVSPTRLSDHHAVSIDFAVRGAADC